MRQITKQYINLVDSSIKLYFNSSQITKEVQKSIFIEQINDFINYKFPVLERINVLGLLNWNIISQSVLPQLPIIYRKKNDIVKYLFLLKITRELLDTSFIQLTTKLLGNVYDVIEVAIKPNNDENYFSTKKINDKNAKILRITYNGTINSQNIPNVDNIENNELSSEFNYIEIENIENTIQYKIDLEQFNDAITNKKTKNAFADIIDIKNKKFIKAMLLPFIVGFKSYIISLTPVLNNIFKTSDNERLITSGSMILSNEGIDNFTEIDIYTFLSFHKNINKESVIIDLIKNINSHSIKSALSAIMSRNMSHNIGSHVLSYASTNLNHPEDIRVLTEYLQERMDFIAQITSEIPEWSMPMRFEGQLMKNFYKQRILLNYIAFSEGLTAFEKDDKDNVENKLQIIILDNEGKRITDKNGKIKEDFKDPLIAIPGGITGTHAFYTIIENIIRNAAKHSYNKKDNKHNDGLKIYIQIIDKEKYNKDFIIKIYDNVTVSSKKIFDTLNKGLNESFINETGELKQKNWGLAEIKTGAGYLQQKQHHEIGEKIDKKEAFIELILLEKKKTKDDDKEEKYNAVTINEVNIENTDLFIGYEFKIPKPKNILLVEKCDNNIYKEFIKDKKVFEKINDKNLNLDFEFVLLKNECKNEFKNERLPHRKLFYKEKYIIENEKYEESKIKKEELYKLWINKIKEKNKEYYLQISPYGSSTGGSNINAESAYRYAAKSLLEKYKKNKNIIKEFKNFINEKDKKFSDLVVKLVQSGKTDVLTELMNKKHQITEIFYKKGKEEKSQSDNTEKNNLLFKIDKDGEITKKETIEKETIEKGAKIIKYIRHAGNKGENEKYLEALSGSQSYFKSIENFVKDNDLDKNKFFAYSLIENALMDITVVDERVHDFYDSDSSVKQRFENQNIHAYKNLDKLIKNIEKHKNNKKRNILIVHQALIKEEDIKDITNEFKYVFITSGSGGVGNSKNEKGGDKNNKALFISFANVRSSLMRQYPEKYILVRTLMKTI